jgi:arylsulfatase
MELDHRTGQVLDAIKAAGIEDNTIVLWLSDNAAAPTSGPFDSRPGSNGPFRGELGDALEGSIRTVGMIKWPGKIAPRASNEMVSVHDIFPTLAGIIGAKVPVDRPIDGVDQSAFFTGTLPRSSRESLITFIGEDVAAVRWRQFRIYPKQFAPSRGNPAMYGLAGIRLEGTGFPAVFNIEAGPARGRQRSRHQRLGDRTLPKGDRRVPEDAGAAPQSQGGQHDGLRPVTMPHTVQTRIGRIP